MVKIRNILQAAMRKKSGKKKEKIKVGHGGTLDPMVSVILRLTQPLVFFSLTIVMTVLVFAGGRCTCTWGGKGYQDDGQILAGS